MYNEYPYSLGLHYDIRDANVMSHNNILNMTMR